MVAKGIRHTGMGIVAITGKGETGDEDVEDTGGFALGGLFKIPIFLMLMILGIIHFHDGVAGRVFHGDGRGRGRDEERSC
jgi:hypothetical protein